MTLGDVGREVKQFGALRTAEDLALRALNRVMVARVLKGVMVDTIDPEYLRLDERYEAGFIERDRLAEMVRNHPEYETPPEFLREAFRKGDECFGLVEGGVLASYGWYSRCPTRVDVPGLTLRFDRHYVYMYKGFTHTRHRGRRLHAIGMSRALNAYVARGFLGIVSYVDWNNFPSLRSCYRMGYRDFGDIYVLGAGGHYLIHADLGCRRYDFSLERGEAGPAGVGALG